MNVKDWLKAATSTLQGAAIESARLDCLILLEDATSKDRAWLLAHPEYELPKLLVTELDKKVAHRSTHVPLAYIRGHVEFYGRDFAVNEHVLVPRPETEEMVELLKVMVSSGSVQADNLVIVDVGTGSGALAITAKLEVPQAHVIGVDIDPACLAVGHQNAAALGVGAEVAFRAADLLEVTDGGALLPEADVILANLPYVPQEYPINKAAGHEPELALFGGADGLVPYRKLFQYLSERQQPLKPEHLQFVITEALEFQHSDLAKIAGVMGYQLEKTAGLAQCFVRRLN